jgi:hypothetical protein
MKGKVSPDRWIEHKFIFRTDWPALTLLTKDLVIGSSARALGSTLVQRLVKQPH